MTQRRKANQNDDSGTVLYRATRYLISWADATEVGFSPWSLPLSEADHGIARIRFNKAYIFERGPYEWLILPGTIECDPDHRFMRGLLLIPNIGAEYPGPTKDFFSSFFTGDPYDKAIWCVAMRNGAFMTNDDALHMGPIARTLEEAAPATGEDTATKILPDDVIIGSRPTTRDFSLSGRIQYKRAYANKLFTALLNIVVRYR